MRTSAAFTAEFRAETSSIASMNSVTVLTCMSGLQEIGVDVRSTLIAPKLAWEDCSFDVHTCIALNRTK